MKSQTAPKFILSDFICTREVYKIEKMGEGKLLFSFPQTHIFRAFERKGSFAVCSRVCKQSLRPEAEPLASVKA